MYWTLKFFDTVIVYIISDFDPSFNIGSCPLLRMFPKLDIYSVESVKKYANVYSNYFYVNAKRDKLEKINEQKRLKFPKKKNITGL